MALWLTLPVVGLMHGATCSSLLGRDILSHFALFMEERTDRVLLTGAARIG